MTAPHDPAPHADASPTPGGSGPSGGQQLAEGARQMLNGAKQLYGSHVAPAVKDGVGSLRSKGASGGSAAGLHRLAGGAVAVLGLLGIFSLFLPLATFLGSSLGWFSPEAPEGEGPLLLLAFLLAAGAGVAAFLFQKGWARITAGVLALIVGFFGVVDGFGNIFRLQEASAFIAPGASLYLIGLIGVLMLAAGVLLLLPARVLSSFGRAPQVTSRVDG